MSIRSLVELIDVGFRIKISPFRAFPVESTWKLEFENGSQPAKFINWFILIVGCFGLAILTTSTVAHVSDPAYLMFNFAFVIFVGYCLFCQWFWMSNLKGVIGICNEFLKQKQTAGMPRPLANNSNSSCKNICM